MAGPFDAAFEVAAFLLQHNKEYVIIGGLAVQVWGRERLTVDADMTLRGSLEEGTTPLVRLITSRFRSRAPDPIEFARRTCVIPITASNGVDVDVSLSVPGYEDSLFERAIDFELEPGQNRAPLFRGRLDYSQGRCRSSARLYRHSGRCVSSP